MKFHKFSYHVDEVCKASGMHPKMAGPATLWTQEEVLLLWIIVVSWNCYVQWSEDNPSRDVQIIPSLTTKPHCHPESSMNVEGRNSSKSANWPWILLLSFSKCCKWSYCLLGLDWNICLSWCSQNRCMIVNFLVAFAISSSSLSDCVNNPDL